LSTALIAEDEPLLAAALAGELARAWPGLQLVAQVGDGSSALRDVLARRPAVCFLDIRMPGLSGLEVAEALVEEWPADAADAFPLIVFVTAHDEFAVQAFAVRAVDYLVKPVTAARLDDCVARLRQRLAAQPGEALQRTLDQLKALLPDRLEGPPATGTPGPAHGAAPRLDVIQAQVGQTVHLVPVDEVLYFEAADKYVRVVTAEREHLIRLSLKELLPQLDAQRFWQVHRGTVVQVRCVSAARRDDSGKVFLSLRDRPETLVASRLYAHLFKGM
jgi:DNA-binding LytR/AlgR family response regulator